MDLLFVVLLVFAFLYILSLAASAMKEGAKTAAQKAATITVFLVFGVPALLVVVLCLLGFLKANWLLATGLTILVVWVRSEIADEERSQAQRKQEISQASNVEMSRYTDEVKRKWVK